MKKKIKTSFFFIEFFVNLYIFFNFNDFIKGVFVIRRNIDIFSIFLVV
jgi:hypothetical protein